MKLYAVLKADGTIRRAGAAGTGRLAVYADEKRARRRAGETDSVVELDAFISTRDDCFVVKEPTFIRGKRLGADVT